MAEDFDWLAAVAVAPAAAEAAVAVAPAAVAVAPAGELAIAAVLAVAPVGARKWRQLPHPRRRNADQHRLAASYMREGRARARRDRLTASMDSVATNLRDLADSQGFPASQLVS